MTAGLRHLIEAGTAETKALSFGMAEFPMNHRRTLPLPGDQTKIVPDNEGRAISSEVGGIEVGKGPGWLHFA